MKNKSIIWILILIVLVSNFIPIISSYKIPSKNIIYVDDDGGADYTKIQDAIDNASDGDTVYVYSGFYEEYVTVNREIILQGEDRNTTIIKGNSSIYFIGVVTIYADSVEIYNFTIQNGNWGIRIKDSTNNIIRGNNLYYQRADGIYLWNSTHNILSDNILYKNSFGIELGYSSNYNTIKNNSIIDNSQIGLIMSKSSYNTIIGNKISNNEFEGIYIILSSNNNINGNDIINHTRYGVFIASSENNNIITSNNFINNTAFDDSNNTWNTDKGNYWSDYQEKYPNARKIWLKGIWDIPYEIDENNMDRYPLVREYKTTKDVTESKIKQVSSSPSETKDSISMNNEELKYSDNTRFYRVFYIAFGNFSANRFYISGYSKICINVIKKDNGRLGLYFELGKAFMMVTRPIRTLDPFDFCINTHHMAIYYGRNY